MDDGPVRIRKDRGGGVCVTVHVPLPLANATYHDVRLTPAQARRVAQQLVEAAGAVV